MGLEDEARVVIEVAAEARGEIERGDVEPARGDEAEALVEDIEPGAQVETGVLRPARAARARRRPDCR